MALLLFNAAVHSAEFCVTNANELRIALSTAANNNQHDEIRIEMGDYETFGNPFSYQESQGYDLDISGGWVEFFGNDCGVQAPAAFLDTTLDGSGTDYVMILLLSGASDLSVSRLAFLNGNAPSGRGGGLHIQRLGNANTGHVTVEQNEFFGNKAAWGSAMSIFSGERVDIRNNLVVNNEVTNQFAIEVVIGEAYGIFFNNNTVTGNFSTNSEDSGVYLAAGSGSGILVANNVLYQNMSKDLHITGIEYESHVFRNNLGVTQMGAPMTEYGNFNLPPRFMSATSPYYLQGTASPLIDAGANPCGAFCPFPTPLVNNWSLGDVDLMGQLREQGERVDIGAFESSLFDDLIFWNRFD